MRLQSQLAIDDMFKLPLNSDPVQQPLERKAERPRATVRSKPRARASAAAAPESRTPTRVLISDDHAIVRRGVRTMIETDPSFEIVGEASSGNETLELVKLLKPHIVVLDISMPGENGLDVTRRLRREAPDVKILILTMHFAEEVARECLRAGARAYVVKTDSDQDVLAAVRAVRDERAYFTPQIQDLYYTGYMDCKPNAPPEKNGELPLDRLTPREVEVVKMLCEGLSNKEVASSVGISTRTVESHRNNVMRKLHLVAFSQLVRYAIRHGVVNP